MSNVVIKEYLSHKIVFTSDGWLNATQTAKNYGKVAYEYLRSKATKEYVKVISKANKCKEDDLIITYKGNTKEFEQGTYINEIFKDHFLNWLIKTTDNKLQRIYILRGGEYVKIGITNDIEYRLKQLQTGNPFKLEVLFITDLIENAYELELFILKNYREKAMQGEWFKFSEEDIQNCIKYINSNKY